MLFINLGAFAQTPGPVSFKDRLFFGGNVGLGFGGGNNSTGFYAELSPLVGYKITDRWSAGPGFINQYKYEKFTLSPGNPKEFESYNYGIRFFTQYLVFSTFFVHGEYEALSYNYLSYNPFNGDIQQFRRNVESLFIGGGYRSYINDRSAIDITVLFNLNESRYSPYPNPIFRVGFVFI